MSVIDAEIIDVASRPQQLDATIAKAFTSMGILHDEQQWSKVVDIGDAWLEARGGMNPTAATWYAQALMGVGRYTDSVKWADLAAHNMPRDEPVPRIASWSTFAQALSRVGQFDRAKRAMTTALGIDADHAETIEKQGHMLATIAMTAKKPVVVRGKQVQPSALWGMSWAMMESRLSKEDKKLPPGFRPWDGVTQEPVAVMHEQGLGDAILTARWLPMLVERTGHPVTYYGPPILGGWMADVPGVVLGDFDETQRRASAGEDLGAAIRCMSLPHHQHMKRADDVLAPWAPAVLRSGRAYRDTTGPVKIGVCWKGAAIGWHDFERSYTPEQFSTIWQPLGGCAFVNLAHEGGVSRDIAPFDPVTFDDVMHTARVISELDIVVTVDTGVAHIAGSLGVPTIVIPPTVPDWRWQWPRGQSTPFYPSIIVVRRRYADDEDVLKTARTVTEMYAGKLREQRAA